MKRLICFNLLPVLPVIRAWSIDLSVVELGDDPAKEPVHYPCTYPDFLSIVTEKFPDSSSVSALSGCSTLPGGEIAGPLLNYSGIVSLLDVLEGFCAPEVMPNGRGGILVQAEFVTDDDSLFKSLTRA